MNWQSKLIHKLRWKLVHGSRFPKTDLPSCLLNLASRGFEPRHIVDVGANRGKWSRDASRVFPNSGYTLIEPQVEMESRLCAFCKRGKTADIFWLERARFSGKLPFTVNPDTVSSSFAVSAASAAKHGFQQRVVPLITIDHVVETVIHAVPDIIKIDAEGFEQEVVKGCQSVLGKTEVFFLEGHFLAEPNNPSDFANLTAFMADLDYAAYDFSWFGRRRFDGALHLCEILFVRRNGFLRSLRAGVPSTYSSPSLDAHEFIPKRFAA